MIKELPIEQHIKPFADLIIEAKFGNNTYIIEFKIKKSLEKWLLLTYWQPSIHNMTWINFIIIDKKINPTADYPVEFIEYCNKFLKKFFNLKSFY